MSAVVYGGGAVYGGGVAYGGQVFPGNLLMLAQNILEGSGLTSSPNGTKIERLADRDRGPQWSGTGAVLHDILIAAPYAAMVTALAIVNHNISAIVEVAGSTSTTFGAPFATGLVASDPFLLLFAEQTFPFYNVRINAGPNAPRIGELVLGQARIVAPPALAGSSPARVSNVQRDRARSGYVWSAKLGPKRDRLSYSWAGLGGDDTRALDSTRTECEDGAKPLVVRDPLGIVRWMLWTSETFAPVPVTGPLSSNLYEIPDVTFEESL